MSLCPSEISHGLTWDRIRASAVRGERPATNRLRQYTRTSDVREQKFVEGKNANFCLYISTSHHITWGTTRPAACVRITSALEGCEWSALRSGRFSPGREIRLSTE